MLQSLAEIFSRNVITIFPLLLQRVVFIGKHLSDFLDHIGNKRIRLLDSRTRFIHKPALDLIPERPKMF